MGKDFRRKRTQDIHKPTNLGKISMGVLRVFLPLFLQIQKLFRAAKTGYGATHTRVSVSAKLSSWFLVHADLTFSRAANSICKNYNN